MSETEPPYEVGYGKPLRGAQFSKGQAGNPKRSRNLVVLRERRQRIIPSNFKNSFVYCWVG